MSGEGSSRDGPQQGTLRFVRLRGGYLDPMTKPKTVTQQQPGTTASTETGPTNTNAIADASRVSVGTDVAGTPAAKAQAAPVGGLNAPGTNVDRLNMDQSGTVLNDKPDTDDGLDDDGKPIVKDRGPEQDVAAREAEPGREDRNTI